MKPEATAQHVWAVVLVSGAGALDRTLQRLGRVVPPERTVVVGTASEPGWPGAVAAKGPHVLVEPQDRGTAATILLPAHWIHARDPRASVVVLGGDLPVRSEAAFVCHIALAARCAEQYSDSLILTGLPQRAQSELGFIVPGERIKSAGAPLFRVQHLIELGPDIPRPPHLDRALANAPVLAGCTEALISAGAEAAPALHDRLARAVAFAGHEHEHWALKQAYALAPRADFFRSVLRGVARSLAVIAVADVGREDPGEPGWSLGSPPLALDAAPLSA